jgi:stage V sporulation protein B
MEQYSITIIGQSTLKTVLAPILIIIGPSTFGAILGTTIAFLIAGLISILLLLRVYKKLQKPNDDKRTRVEIGKNMKIMFKYGLPLEISGIIGGFLTQFYTILVAIYATDLMIGNYQVALNFSVLITFFSVPVSTVLFPVFSKLDAQKENETFRSIFQFSVKYGALLTVPAATGVMVLSQPLVAILFGQKYTYAPLFVVLLAMTYLFSALGSLSVGNVINGQGKTRFSLELAIIGTAVGLPLSILLIPIFGVTGLLVTVIVAGIPGLIIGLWWIRKHFGATLEWTSSAKILLASATSGAIAYSLISQLSFNSWIQLIAGAAVFLIAFLIITPMTRTVNRTDTQNLRQMLAELGPLRPLFNFILDIIERLMTLLRV